MAMMSLTVTETSNDVTSRLTNTSKRLKVVQSAFFTPQQVLAGVLPVEISPTAACPIVTIVAGLTLDSRGLGVLHLSLDITSGTTNGMSITH